VKPKKPPGNDGKATEKLLRDETEKQPKNRKTEKHLKNNFSISCDCGETLPLEGGCI
jgi:hypothetical protein